jgi:hypothetical protein
VRRYSKGDGGFIEMSNGQEIPVSRQRKEALLQMLLKSSDISPVCLSSLCRRRLFSVVHTFIHGNHSST